MSMIWSKPVLHNDVDDSIVRVSRVPEPGNFMFVPMVSLALAWAWAAFRKKLTCL
jgi:hypothetical protein